METSKSINKKKFIGRDFFPILQKLLQQKNIKRKNKKNKHIFHNVFNLTKTMLNIYDIIWLAALCCACLCTKHISECTVLLMCFPLR